MIRPLDQGAPFLLATPEHVPLRFALASLGSRVAALTVDLMIQFGIILAWIILVVIAFSDGASEILATTTLLLVFGLRNFYFTFSELYWQGRTIGKRLLKLRVVARDGGPLTADLVFARNLTRELETFLPLTALMAPGSLVPEGPWWASLATIGWVLALTLLPWLNRHRARLGDLLAGTVVVVEPTAELMQDLVRDAREARVDAEYAFTPHQLAIYGIRELQVLEEVLRQEPSDNRDETLRLITLKVTRKIGWVQPEGTFVQPERFLTAFYTAQRGRLEQDMLFGKRREKKVR